VIARNRATAARLGEAFCGAVGSHPAVRHLRQQGMMLAFDVAGAPPGFARRFFAEALARELLLRPIGNTVYTMPPYILSGAEIDHLASQTAAALEASLG
jgi:adenosylmethionine-8-amino-7-oxononanoate aminotransferase